MKTQMVEMMDLLLKIRVIEWTCYSFQSEEQPVDVRGRRSHQ